MRCKECNVDLAEGVKVCPLCKSEAVNEDVVLKGMKTAEYPEYGELRPLKYYIRKNDVYFGKYLMWIVLALSAVSMPAAYFLDKLSLVAYTVLPVLFAVTSIVYFVTSLISKKNAVKSPLYFIVFGILSLVIVAVGYLTTKEIGTATYALASALVSFLGLMVLSSKYPKEVDAELGGRFHR